MFCKFLDAAQLILHVTEKLTILPRITIGITQSKFIDIYAPHESANINWTVKAWKTKQKVAPL